MDCHRFVLILYSSDNLLFSNEMKIEIQVPYSRKNRHLIRRFFFRMRDI